MCREPIHKDIELDEAAPGDPLAAVNAGVQAEWNVIIKEYIKSFYVL